MGKHVIFLGAGASVSSGYPLARELTLLMADDRTKETALAPLISDIHNPIDREQCSLRFRGFEAEAGEFLRDGCFETMDSLGHFCAGRGQGNLIPSLKRLMRFCLSLHNPLEENYGTTDYRPFVQALLRNSPESPDDGVAVLSLNYDPFLDYLLHLAVSRRSSPEKPLQSDSSLVCAVTSGFSKRNNLEWLSGEGFCHLKLHGVIAPPHPDFAKRRTRPHVDPRDSTPFNTWDLFSPIEGRQRLFNLMQEPFVQSEPPVFLPWEILTPNGDLRGKEDFVRELGEDQWQLHPYADLIRGIWERARREVQEATKLSFVGLSMNPLLMPGLRYLLRKKPHGGASLVVVNPDVNRFHGPGLRFHPRSATGKVAAAIRQILGERFETFKSDSEGGSDAGRREFFGEDRQAGVEHEVTQYATFAEFIEAELG